VPHGKGPPLKHLGVDEIHLGKKTKFLTVSSNLESAEPLWFGRERKTETLDEFFKNELTAGQRKRIEAAGFTWTDSEIGLKAEFPAVLTLYASGLKKPGRKLKTMEKHGQEPRGS
jgi:hypothetical protein